MYRTNSNLQSTEPELLLSAIVATAQRLDDSLGRLTRLLDDVRSRMMAWNDKHAMTQRVLILDTRTEAEEAAKLLRANLQVPVDVVTSAEDAKEAWNKHKHSVLLVELDINNVEFAKDVGRGPHVLLLTDDEHSARTALHLRTARNLDAQIIQRTKQSLDETLQTLTETVRGLLLDEEGT